MVTNGKIPTALLSKVDATHYAAPGTVSAFRAWSVKMVALGYPALTVGNATDSCYRSYAWQVYRYNLHASNPARYPVAAYPGTSNHGLGTAIDIGNYYRYPHSLLVKWGKVYGFRFDTPSELWHVKYVGAPAYKSLNTPTTTTLHTLEEDVSALVTATKQPNKPTFHVSPGLMVRISPAELDPFRKVTGLKRWDMTDANFVSIIGPFGFHGLTWAQINAVPVGGRLRAAA